jgi:hypothetical protein
MAADFLCTVSLRFFALSPVSSACLPLSWHWKSVTCHDGLCRWRNAGGICFHPRRVGQNGRDLPWLMATAIAILDQRQRRKKLRA